MIDHVRGRLRARVERRCVTSIALRRWSRRSTVRSPAQGVSRYVHDRGRQLYWRSRRRSRSADRLSSSTAPTLHFAARRRRRVGRSTTCILNRLAYDFGAPERGQIVVFKTPPAASICGAGDGGQTFVKRLIGLPGEQVSERDGSIFINGTRLNEPYVDPAFRDNETGTWPRIPADHYFFLGDDRAHSCDSRTWGSPAQQPHRTGARHLLATEPVGLALDKATERSDRTATTGARGSACCSSDRARPPTPASRSRSSRSAAP